MGWNIRTFGELTTEELYKILMERVSIFVVEQECPYPEIDGKDELALHLFLEKDGKIAAYARLFKGGDYYEEASIGRILVKDSFRKTGLGKDLLSRAISIIQDEWKEKEIKIQAQNYLRDFYSSFGFRPITEIYLEDNIPHVDMVLKN
ncbi:GNAT family N-acetyltransferase [Evansella tamaricis]|uniref:GNAT family N-acetyltransferase n=1 Tax=Evansella tamaricis TaxID=2069301 RepID=A0ABS6JGF8_9BACI|nr:GNAT family N-acetyltransferase [Evansella tamaricis]MBU9711413.1 GNAT family N-acetyltransferase [Evansella tamaricis]